MDRSSREEFIEAVCAQVRFTPARKQIADELRGHLEDRAEALMARGLTPGPRPLPRGPVHANHPISPCTAAEEPGRAATGGHHYRRDLGPG